MRTFKLLLILLPVFICGCSNSGGSSSITGPISYPDDPRLDPFDRSSDAVYEASILKYINEDVNDDFEAFEHFKAIYLTVKDIEDGEITYSTYYSDTTLKRENVNLRYVRTSAFYHIDTRNGLISYSELIIGDILIAKSSKDAYSKDPYEIDVYRLFLVGHENNYIY